MEIPNKRNPTLSISAATANAIYAPSPNLLSKRESIMDDDVQPFVDVIDKAQTGIHRAPPSRAAQATREDGVYTPHTRIQKRATTSTKQRQGFIWIRTGHDFWNSIFHKGYMIVDNVEMEVLIIKKVDEALSNPLSLLNSPDSSTSISFADIVHVEPLPGSPVGISLTFRVKSLSLPVIDAPSPSPISSSTSSKNFIKWELKTTDAPDRNAWIQVLRDASSIGARLRQLKIPGKSSPHNSLGRSLLSPQQVISSTSSSANKSQDQATQQQDTATIPAPLSTSSVDVPTNPILSEVEVRLKSGDKSSNISVSSSISGIPATIQSIEIPIETAITTPPRTELEKSIPTTSLSKLNNETYFERYAERSVKNFQKLASSLLGGSNILPNPSPQNQEDMPDVNQRMSTEKGRPNPKLQRPTIKSSAAGVNAPDLLLSGADPNFMLPKTIVRKDCKFRGERLTIVVIGVAHTDPVSRLEVRSTIEAIKPNSVIVELDPANVSELEKVKEQHEKPFKYLLDVYGPLCAYIPCTLGMCICGPFICPSRSRGYFSRNHQKMIDVQLAFSGSGFGFELLEAVHAGRRVGAHIVYGTQSVTSGVETGMFSLKMKNLFSITQKGRYGVEDEDLLDLIQQAGFGNNLSVKDFMKQIRNTDSIEALLDSVRNGDIDLLIASQIVDFISMHKSSKAQDKARTQFLHALSSNISVDMANALLYRASGRVRVCVVGLPHIVGLLMEIESILHEIEKDDDEEFRGLTLEGARNLLEQAVECNKLSGALEACSYFSKATAGTESADAQNFIIKADVDASMLRCLKLYLGDNRDDANTLFSKIFEVFGDLASNEDVVLNRFSPTASTCITIDSEISAVLLSKFKTRSLVMEGCYILGNIALAPGNSIGIVARGSHLSILNAMRHYEKDVEILECGAFALLSLSKELKCRKPLIEDGALEVLEESLNKNPNRPNLARDAIEAIANLVNIKLNSDIINLPFIISGANRVCLKQLRIIVNKYNRTSVGSASSLTAPSQILTLSKGESDVAIVTSSAVHTLSLFQNNSYQLAELGMGQTMTELLRICWGVWQVQLNCCLVFQELVKVPGCKNDLIAVGLLEMLESAKAKPTSPMSTPRSSNERGSTNFVPGEEILPSVRKEIDNTIRALKKKDDLSEAILTPARISILKSKRSKNTMSLNASSSRHLEGEETSHPQYSLDEDE